jgi:hypothetical protein
MTMSSPALSPRKRRKPSARICQPALTDFLVVRHFAQNFIAVMSNLFSGQAYNYDDHNLTEEWMCSYEDSIANGPSDDEVIRTQLESLMDIMCAQVVDSFCNSTGVLKRETLQLQCKKPLSQGGVPDDSVFDNTYVLRECPVWGFDSYTRRMIELSLIDGLPAVGCTFAEDSTRKFIENVMLPTINSLPPDDAHNMKNVLSSIIYVSLVLLSSYVICELIIA